jgi:ubiquinone/menaquinone biosynthesis C-methylase UbiE
MFDEVRSSDSMRLGKFEFLAMNNFLRRWLQKSIEFPIFKKFLNDNHLDLTNKIIIDGGCGSGYSTKLLNKEYRPQKMIAFDYMPEQIKKAQKRLPGIDFFVGDLRDIKCASRSCDAVFIFGVIHHIPEWEKALQEVYRVLKEGGALLLEEPKYRFSWLELEDVIQRIGFTIKGKKVFRFKRFHSYLCLKGKENDNGYRKKKNFQLA